MAVVYANGGEFLRYWRNNAKQLSQHVKETRTIVIDGKDKRLSKTVAYEAVELITDEKEKAYLKKQLEQIDFPQFAKGRRSVDDFTQPKHVHFQKNGVLQISGLNRFFNITQEELQEGEPLVSINFNIDSNTVTIGRIKF